MWYITNIENDHFSTLSKNRDDDKHELYKFFLQYAPETDRVFQQTKTPFIVI